MMRKSMLFTSGSLQVCCIQGLISALLVTFLHQVLFRSGNPEQMLIVLFHISYDRYSFEWVKELLQLSLFVPVMLYIAVRLVKQMDVEHSYLMIRHRFGIVWFFKTALNIGLLCCEAALTTLITLTVYTKINIDSSSAISFDVLAVLILSAALGMMFYILLTALIALNKPAVLLMLTLVILLSIGKALICGLPEIVRCTAASAIYINHAFEPLSESRLILPGIGHLAGLAVADLAVIGALWFLLYGRIKKMDYIGRRI
ncbi:MAG: hypothetical protein VB070_00430 [Clostridiaceae bacterium]|nr:hypothetical protein [Clostridiaceae bacterium]